VLGLDLSAELLELARRRAAALQLENVRFEQADAQVYPFGGDAFEVAISRFGCMFFGDPVVAYRNLGAALVTGGRLTLLSWGPLDRNEWVREVRRVLAAGAALPSPPAGAPGMFGLSEPERIKAILGPAGFTQIEVTALADPVELGPDASAAVAFLGSTGFARAILEQQAPEQREERLAALREMLAAYESDGGVLIGSEALLTSARRGG
jgi:SAM-dependent methyltransferase